MVLNIFFTHTIWIISIPPYHSLHKKTKFSINPLWTEVGGGWGRGPMDPRHNFFVDYFFSSMFKKLRPSCKFFFLTIVHSVLVIFPKMSSVGEKRGLESIGHPPPSHSCPRLQSFEDQKISNNFFDLT